MGNGVSFRGSLGGYNKKDVNDYITKADREFAEYRSASEEEKARLEAGLKSAEEEAESRKKQFEEAKAECDGQREEIAALSARLAEAEGSEEALEKELIEKRGALSAAENELEALKAEKAVSDRLLNEAEAKISEMEKAGEEESGEIYEEISSKLNSLLSAANSEAEEIVTGAMNRSDEIIEDAKRRADEIVLKASSQAEGLSEKSAENMRKIAKDIAAEYCEEVTLFATELRDSFNALLRDISAKGIEMSGKLDYLSASVGGDMEKRIIDVTAENALGDGEKEEKAGRPKTPAQTALEAINERIDSFVKSAISA
ncbi:MAG: hypothetical protein J5940_07595, partial [Clostridia bacterium]|nr:hypothetical protein [Clostridia bacterium]